MLGGQPVFAAKTQPAGTCFYYTQGPAQTNPQIGSCKSFNITTKQKDSDQNLISYSNCYEVQGIDSRATITQVKCDDTPLKPSTNKQMCADSNSGKTAPCVNCSDGSVAASEAECSQPATVAGGNCQSLSKCDLMSTYINPLIKFLAALVGVVVVVSVIIGGIQYSSSAGDPQAATAARKRITNAIIALVVFIFLYALLNFLIPGGLG